MDQLADLRHLCVLGMVTLWEAEDGGLVISFSWLHEEDEENPETPKPFFGTDLGELISEVRKWTDSRRPQV